MSLRSTPLSPLRRWGPWFLALLLCCTGLARAQTNDNDNAGDPPDRVARLAYLSGELDLLPAGAQDWGRADLNRPLTRGDRLSSDVDARAELEFDGASMRLAGGTDTGVLELNDQLAQLELTRGTLSLTVRHLADGQSYEIDTPTVALVVDRPGTFRVDVDRDGTRVTAFAGDATVYGENGVQRDVYGGRSYRINDSALSMVTISDINGGDAFDAWCSERDRRYAAAGTSRYLSDEMIGYQDLVDYGTWRSDPEYGTVWYPGDVADDWAPYRFGRWVWIAPWGWTWVDDSPWGFAPYHYGRWAYARDGWCWIPGPIGLRPIYAPALVAFFGGRGWSVSLGIGDAPIGWFPLGPGEIYNPWYRASRGYYGRINLHNIRVRDHRRRAELTERIDHQYGDYRRGVAERNMAYANHRAHRGITAMPARGFADARQVRHERLHLDPAQLAAAPMLGRGHLLAPTDRSHAPPRAARARPLPVGAFDRAVVAHHAPPPGTGRRGTEASGPARWRATAARSEPANARAPSHSDQRRPPVSAHDVTARLPVVPVIRAATPTTHPQWRAGELPSARFARSARSVAADRTDEAVRREGPRDTRQPGVGDVHGMRQDRPQRPISPARLPAVPRIQPGVSVRHNEAARFRAVEQPSIRPRREPYRAAPEVVRAPATSFREAPPVRAERRTAMPFRNPAPQPSRGESPGRAAPAHPAASSHGNRHPPMRADDRRR